jgi:hypothetical protein
MCETYPAHFADNYNIPQAEFEQYVAEHPMEFIEDRQKPEPAEPAKQAETQIRLGDDLFNRLDSAPQKQGLLARFVNRAKEALHIDTPQQTTDDRDEL